MYVCIWITYSYTCRRRLRDRCNLIYKLSICNLYSYSTQEASSILCYGKLFVVYQALITSLSCLCLRRKEGKEAP